MVCVEMSVVVAHEVAVPLSLALGWLIVENTGYFFGAGNLLICSNFGS